MLHVENSIDKTSIHTEKTLNSIQSAIFFQLFKNKTFQGSPG